MTPVADHPPRTFFAQTTSYCQQGRMADGTYVRPGSVAMNSLPLHTKIRLVGSSFRGRKVFVVRDRIGWGSEIDFFSSSCTAALQWGRRTIRYRVIGRAR